MKVWVVTGPVGAGKSVVVRLLREKGAAVIDADKLGHEVLEQPLIAQKVAEEFGQECVLAGKVDRKELGKIVFSEPAALKRLNALTHPPLLDLLSFRLDLLARAGKHELAVVEAAVYFLWPPMPVVDLVVAVIAKDEIRMDRLLEHRGLKTREAQERLGAQEPWREFWNRADVILENNGGLDLLEEQVHQLVEHHIT